MDNPPTPHPSAYTDPLKADDEKKAIGTNRSQGITYAIGDETCGEWIRMDGPDIDVEP